jgi:hypothetical protein
VIEQPTGFVMLEASLRFLRGVERTNLLLALVTALVVFGLAGPGPLLWGALAGGLLGALNFRSMIWLGGRILGARHRGRSLYMLLFASKLGVLGLVVWATLHFLPVTPFGLLVGLSTLVPAVLLTSAREGKGGRMSPLHGGQSG